MHNYYTDDFANDSELSQLLIEFIDKIGPTNKKYQQSLTNILQKKMTSHKQSQQLQQSTDSIFSRMESISMGSINNSTSEANFSLTPGSSRSSSTSTNEDQNLSHTSSNYDEEAPPFETHLELRHGYDILTIHPLEFARQATLMESELFKALKPSELITLGWNKPDLRHKLSPNLTKLINLSNKFTYWYAKCIVDTLNLEERVAVVQRILEIAQYFYQMNNFSGMKEIYAAFETSSVIRLEVTREKSSMEQHKIYTKFKQFFENHDKGYLEKIKKCNPPCVPFIGSHLTIILKTQEYNKLNDENHKMKIMMQQQQLRTVGLPNTDAIPQSTPDIEFNTSFKNNLINFSKYRLLVEFVTDLLQYQNMNYKFNVHEKIRSFILEDIENYFKSAQESREDESETSSVNAEMIAMSRPDAAQMVESWLFAKSKQIEPREAISYPRHKPYSLKTPPTSTKTNSNSKSGKFTHNRLNPDQPLV